MLLVLMILTAFTTVSRLSFVKTVLTEFGGSRQLIGISALLLTVSLLMAGPVQIQ